MLAVGKRGKKGISVFNLCIHMLLISRTLGIKRQSIAINTGQKIAILRIQIYLDGHLE